jgi:hypothetical protein
VELIVAGALGRAFRSSTGEAYRQAVLRHQVDERNRRDRKDEMANDAEEFMDFAIAIVSIAEINDFKLELDRYDAATISALQENQRNREIASERLDLILGKAHVLPDGRRVFKTEDGLRVFDETGSELDASVVDPDEIPDWCPRWEAFEDAKNLVDSLQDERADILDYQAKLDEARERLDSGDMTQQDFDELQASLLEDMPDAVRDQFEVLASKLEQVTEASAVAPEELDISDEMVPTSFAAKPPTPWLGG